jgi:hypothetical protein
MFTRLLKPASEPGFLDLVLRLTLLEILMRPVGFWAIRATLLFLAVIGLVLPKVLRAPLTWALLSAGLVWELIDAWPLPDNHIYLLCYWCLAIFLSLRSPTMQRVLAINSRFLLAFTFLFAVLCKAFLSPDYLDGRFFRVTLLQDERFAHTAMFFGRLKETQLLENREYLFPLPEGAELVDPPHLVEPPALQRLAYIFTWSALLTEALIAVALFAPLPDRFKYIRHLLILAFCILTYAFAPVAGFGWLVLVMGLAQCAPQQKRLQWFYFIIYVLVLLYSEIPWTQILWGISG